MAEGSRKNPQNGGPWYSEGLCFECRPDCGACCTNHEDYAYVYLEGDDVDRLVAHLESLVLHDNQATDEGLIHLADLAALRLLALLGMQAGPARTLGKMG